MSSSSAQAYVTWSVRDVRRFIACIGGGFPFLLFLGYWILEGWPVPDAISSYYYSHSMHYVFMISLIGLGVSLIYYQYRDPARDGAISQWDTVISTLAGLFAIGVAVFPPKPDSDKHPTPWQVSIDHAHLASTVLFFLSIAVIVLFFFTRPVGPFPGLSDYLARRFHWDRGAQTPTELWNSRTRRKQQRNRVYVGCGIVILFCGAVLGGWLLLEVLFPVSPPPHTFVFWGETASIFAFAIAWIVKGELVLLDEKEMSLATPLALDDGQNSSALNPRR